MKLRSLLIPTALGLFLFCASAPADAGFQHNVAHKYVSGKTSLKITGADGLKASVTVDGSAKEDTIPAVFSLPDHDAFIPVVITAADGKTFNQKIEVKAHQQTELTIKYEADGKPAAAPAGRKYLGHAVSFMSRCKQSRDLKMEFLRSSDGQSQASLILKPEGASSEQNVEIPAGQYDVRVFTKSGSSDFAFWKTEKLDVNADQWVFAIGCTNKREAAGRIDPSKITRRP